MPSSSPQPVHPLLRAIALGIPALRRIVAERDELRAQLARVSAAQAEALPVVPMPSQSEPWTKPYSPLATADDIFNCFRLLLGRSPGRDEWSWHVGRVGSDLAATVAVYVSSLEFAKRSLDKQDRLAKLRLCRQDGFSIYASEEDAAVGRQLCQGSYEPEVTAIFRRFIKPGMGVVDIGANIGYFTMLSASLVGESGFVLAVEPNAENMKLLEASRRANGFSQVTTALCAAGRDTGLLMLNPFHSNGTTSALSDDAEGLLAAQCVPSFAIGNLVPAGRSVDFLKIDVEGAEYLALSGCRDMLRRCRPFIVSEFSPGFLQNISGVDGTAYLDFLIELGYAIAVIQPDGSLSEPFTDASAVMAIYEARAIDHIDIFARPA